MENKIEIETIENVINFTFFAHVFLILVEYISISFVIHFHLIKISNTVTCVFFYIDLRSGLVVNHN